MPGSLNYFSKINKTTTIQNIEPFYLCLEMLSACRELDGFETEQILRPRHRVRNTQLRHLEKFARMATAGHNLQKTKCPVV